MSETTPTASSLRPGTGRLAIVAQLACLVLFGCGDEPESQIGSDRIVNRLSYSGVDFVHESGAGGRKFLVEINAGCVALLDHDQDGNLDLYFGQGAPLPNSPVDRDYRDRLFAGDGNWMFRDVTDSSNASEPGYTLHVAAPDIDADGDPDLYLSNYADNRFLLNTRGRFEDQTGTVGGATSRWSTASQFADFDRDGDLDLYVANYCVYDLEHEGCGPVHKGDQWRSYCSPKEFPGSADQYFRNEDGQLIDRSEECGIVDATGSALGLALSDHDSDGDVDLFVANDGRPNFLWQNDGHGKFLDIAPAAGVAVAQNGSSEACMGADFADIDLDGDFDLLVANLAMETNTLYRNESADFFEDRSTPSGLGPPSLRQVGFGCELFDVDNDGDADAMVANGHILDNAPLFEPTQTFRQPPHLYLNDSRGRFEERGREYGAYFRGQVVGRGLATGDLDNDGDLDVVVAHNGAAPALLENRAAGGQHWIGFRLVGSGANRDAIGARVEVHVGERILLEEVRGTSSYAAFQDLRIHFGLADQTQVDRVLVRWPDGSKQEFGPQQAGAYHSLVQSPQ